MPEQVRTFDLYGRTFLRSLLSESPDPSTIAALRQIMTVERANFTVDDVASELGMTLPAPAEVIPTQRARRACPTRKVRTRLCL